jgi:hypothetical protein
VAVLAGIVGALVAFTVGVVFTEVIFTNGADWTNVIPFVLAVVGWIAAREALRRRRSHAGVPPHAPQG